ncbi:ubiquitin-like-conjugating enzyme ATG10 [Drosophila rhopaloa]|uniref:Ubiquitin-like-conjugating enzyme ATG10 n=1 Tax=Drosophila rhopaloa TaxID=1041015 RepID=A0A6P4FL41_DRORH|nr:ubiquitin-like-conjugating enzyme ATG10 [Drosophila rhopaloa]XP_016990523.1 ubiquitin-like-conjugating enzyme ATG10 [Drosophila rhopaloa]
MGDLSWKDFMSQAKQFLKISQQLGDSWMLEEKDSNEPNTFLKFNQKMKCQSEEGYSEGLVNVEYHVVYSVSYQVPMLFFQAHRSDGSLLDLEATWKLFMPETKARGLYQILTQMDHPVLFRPFMALHPCRTAEVLKQFGQPSDNQVLTFISLYGPHVQLHLKNAYGLVQEYT